MSISTAPVISPARQTPPAPAARANPVGIVVAAEPAAVSSPYRAVIGPVAVLLGLLGWAYYPMIRVFFDKWVNDPQYSHGFLVPFFSAYVLWQKRTEGLPALRPLPWLGGGLLVLTVAMRMGAGSLLFHQLDAAALLLSLFAVALVVGGMPLARWAGPALLFLVFMVPLPYELERNVGQPLKTAATVSSTFVLQTLGQPALRDGNVILIDEVRLGVVDACSGLKMLVTFAAFSVGCVLLVRRTRFEKLMILLGIVPVAIASNILRIAATGLAYTATSDRATLDFLHDAFGWLMMPVGLAFLALEVWVLKNLVADPDRT